MCIETCKRVNKMKYNSSGHNRPYATITSDTFSDCCIIFLATDFAKVVNKIVNKLLIIPPAAQKFSPSKHKFLCSRW